MKVLTIREPWCSAIVFGPKRIENRTWEAPQRLWGQTIALHASKGFVRADRENALSLSDEGLFTHDDAPGTRGHIIGTATLVGCYTQLDLLLPHLLPCDEQQISDWYTGPIGWLLADILALERPIPATGRLGLWDHEVAT